MVREAEGELRFDDTRTFDTALIAASDNIDDLRRLALQFKRERDDARVAAARNSADAARWRFVGQLAWFVDAVASSVLERNVRRDGAIDAGEAQDAIDDIMTKAERAD
jgi:hypothetical protein